MHTPFVFFILTLTTLPSLLYAFSTSAQSPQETSLISQLVSGNLVWNSLLGEADRAFRLGVQLEKNGQSRKASASFHEAATLYQCYSDCKSEFGHVTCLPEEDCSTILAYNCIRLAFLNLDALGDPNAAARLYRRATEIEPVASAATYAGLGESLQSAGFPLDECLEPYRKAHTLAPDNRSILFHLAVLLERMNQTEEAERYLEILRREEAQYSCLVDSWGYVRWHTRHMENLNLYRGSRSMLKLALQEAMPLIEEGG